MVEFVGEDRWRAFAVLAFIYRDAGPDPTFSDLKRRISEPYAGGR
jgi:hypothetical protein